MAFLHSRGEIYRALDNLLEENAALVEQGKKHLKAKYNVAGYNIFDVKNKEFDLTPLLVGSQGTLGIITEATLEAAKYNPVTKLAHVTLDEIADLNEVLPKIMELKPSILDMVNRAALDQVSKINPNQLSGLLKRPKAAIHLFVEFDNSKEAAQKSAIKSLQKILQKVDGLAEVAENLEEQEKIWKIRQSITTILNHPKGQSKAVPVAEDIGVPINSLVEFLHKANELYAAAGLVAPAWGSAGDGVVRMQPMLDLGQLGDRQKLFKLADALYKTAIELGGSISSAAGDGRVRATYTPLQYGHEIHDVMLKVKKIFDPYNILNPGVKTAGQEEIKAIMRGDYSLSHHHEYLPRS